MELTASTTILLRTLIYLEEMLTQEELPMEPGSGSEGSSTVESTLTTSMWSATALFVIKVGDGLDSTVTTLAKTCRRPASMTIHNLSIALQQCGCHVADRMTSSQPPSRERTISHAASLASARPRRGHMIAADEASSAS